MTTPPFNPGVCADGAGAGGPDVEDQILCDQLADGTIVGSALAVFTYDENGVAQGPPVFVSPTTGLPYVPQGVLVPCGSECSPPVQFCFTSTATGPVDHPGRQYDLTLPLNPGFAVESLTVGATSSPANIVWEVDDHDGEQFRVALTSFMEGRLPAAAVVTITNPNAGVAQVCGAALPMQVHIECLRLDSNPPDLIELLYNAGQDMIQNPAYNESPALNPPVSQGNYGFHLLSRQDDPGPFPGNQPSNDALCTTVANRGWETNDVGRTFEIWGQDVAVGVTPTPRGTPVQEITSDGPPPGGRSTIWQTFVAPASGNFIIRIVHGGRDAGEQHRITLDNGDTNDTQPGVLINDVTTPLAVYGGNPWTTFNQTIPLVGGQTYTLAISTTNPAGGARGGLFTDMRAYIDRPGQRATATTDDDQCVVTTQETVTATDCQWWQPRCTNGDIVSWKNAETGQILANTAFWGQTPAPSCCLPDTTSGGGDGSSTVANLIHSYLICGDVGGVRQTLVRYVITDPSGGVLASQIVGPDGAPVTPSAWSPGGCADAAFVNDFILCDNGVAGGQRFLRKYVQQVNAAGNPTVVSHGDFDLTGSVYAPVGPVGVCADPFVLGDVCVTSDAAPGVVVPAVALREADGSVTYLNVATGEPWPGVLTVVVCPAPNVLTEEILCDQGSANAPFRRVYSLSANGSVVVADETLTGAPYTVVGPVGSCGAASGDTEVLSLCDVVAGTPVPFLRRQTFTNGVLTSTVDTTPAGAAYVVAGTVATCTELDAEIVTLCDAGNSNHPYIRRFTYNTVSGAQVGTGTVNLDGSAYTVVGPEGTCSGTDAESLILCDSAASPVRFLRTYRYTAAGAVAGFTDTTLAGAAFTPTGAVGVCATAVTNDTDFVEEVLCDANGTSFIRLFRFNSATGVLISTTNTTLAGAAFTPVGAVGLCSDCCPAVIGNGCTNTGSGFYTAIRATNGTISLIDSVTGAAIVQANIVPCPSDDTTVTLVAEHQDVIPGSPWTPPGGQVITSVTYTILAGTATVVDGAGGTSIAALPAGLSVTWTADDDNTLTPPASITADAASRVYVNWTHR